MAKIDRGAVNKTHVEGQHIREAGKDGLRGKGQRVCILLHRVIDL